VIEREPFLSWAPDFSVCGRPPRTTGRQGTSPRTMESLLNRLRALLIQEDHPSRAGRLATNLLRLIYFAVSEFRRARCMQRALELAYGTLFTMVPVTSLFLLISRTAGSLDRWIQDGRRFIISLTIGALPPEDSEAIDAFVERAFTAISRGLEGSGAVTSVASFLVLVAFAIALLLSIESVFNGIFGVRRRRTLIGRVTVFWTIITLSPLLLASSMYMRSQIIEMLVSHNWVSPPTQWGLRFLFPFAFSALAFFILYFKMPYTRVRAGAAAGGAIVACALWEVAKSGVSWYVAENVTYKNIYGTLGTIPIFLLFLYVTWVITLFGAEVAYAGHHFHQIRRREVMRHLGERVAGSYLAVKAAVLLADRFRRGVGPAGANDLAEALEIDAAQVEGMLERLEEAELVVAVAYPEGAFQLARSPSSITVENLVRGAGALELVPDGDGRVSQVLHDMRRASVEAAKGVTLEDLLMPEAVDGSKSASG
jgi:membrane protein